jgi:hypothetical protein
MDPRPDRKAQGGHQRSETKFARGDAHVVAEQAVPPDNPIRCDSGGPTLVAMAEAADLGECDDLSPRRAVLYARLARQCQRKPRRCAVRDSSGSMGLHL